MTIRTEEMLTQFLVPLDVEKKYDQVVWLMRCIAVTLGQRVEKITLLYVSGGRYLSQHMTNIDSRAGDLISSEKFRELRQIHIDQHVMPILEEVRKTLVSAGIDTEIDILVQDGDPVEQIVKTVNTGPYSSLILQRSDKSTVEAMFIGSVASGILHREVQASIYLPPANGVERQPCPPANCLVALDDSDNSFAALERAKILISASGNSFRKIILANVVDLAAFSEALAAGIEAESLRTDVLDRAAAQLREAGVPEEKIVCQTGYGEPAEELVNMVQEHDIDVVFMGRRDRGALQDVFMGSVSNKIIQQCTRQTIVLVNAKSA